MQESSLYLKVYKIHNRVYYVLLILTTLGVLDTYNNQEFTRIMFPDLIGIAVTFPIQFLLERWEKKNPVERRIAYTVLMVLLWVLRWIGYLWLLLWLSFAGLSFA